MAPINYNSSKKVFKNPTIDINALFNSLRNSTCSSPEVVLAFLLYEGSIIHNASDQFVSCVYFFFVDFAFHSSPQTKIGSARAGLTILCTTSLNNQPIGKYTRPISRRSISIFPFLLCLDFRVSRATALSVCWLSSCRV